MYNFLMQSSIEVKILSTIILKPVSFPRRFHQSIPRRTLQPPLVPNRPTRSAHLLFLFASQLKYNEVATDRIFTVEFRYEN